MYYVPQSIAVHNLQERQNFRKGNCSAYENPVLYVAPAFLMPNIFVKRIVSGAAFTVTLCDLSDNDITTLTPTAEQDWPLDAVGEFEMHVFEGGEWPGVLSLMDGGVYYLKLDDGDNTYYTDEFLLSYSDGLFPANCGENWAKLSWLVNGTCIVSGTTSVNAAEPVHAYPQADYWNFVYLNANLSRGEWEYDEKGEEDAHGIVQPDTRKLVKRWVLEGPPITESLYDMLTTSSISDRVLLEFADGTVFDYLRDVRTEPSWENGGCLVTVRYKFSTDYIVKQGCC